MLGLVPIGVGQEGRDSQRAALQTRRIDIAAKPPAPVTAPVAAPVTAPTPELPRRLAPPPAAPRLAAAASAPLAVMALEPTPPAALVEAPLPIPELAETAAPAMPQLAAGTEVPVFATAPPSAVQLHYELRRGGLVGQAELVWRPTGERYQLSMSGQAFGATLISWVSRGSFDSAGLAPERFLDRRQTRQQQAANFQREAGRITFSGPATVHPLVPGAQDRLSWMVQLAAIVQAAAPAPEAGARFPIFVVGARGDADVWSFTVQGRETIDLPAGRAEGALLLLREPRGGRDIRVEVWLDPARQHLPVQLRTTNADGEVNQFQLYELRWL